jgi:nicotinate phosphoribosyltransferase
VVKRSENKATVGGRKTAVRRHKPTGTATEEMIVPQGTPVPKPHDRPLQRPYVRGGEVVPDLPTLEDSRELLRHNLISIPWEGLKLSQGEPTIPVVCVPASTKETG